MREFREADDADNKHGPDVDAVNYVTAPFRRGQLPVRYAGIAPVTTVLQIADEETRALIRPMTLAELEGWKRGK